MAVVKGRIRKARTKVKAMKLCVKQKKKSKKIKFSLLFLTDNLDIHRWQEIAIVVQSGVQTVFT